MDSCSGPKFLECVKDRDNYEQLEMCCEPCESCSFSFYVNVEGKSFPCSFCEGEDGYVEGVDIVNCKDFINDIWFGKMAKEFRKKLSDTLENSICRSCPVFDI